MSETLGIGYNRHDIPGRDIFLARQFDVARGDVWTQTPGSNFLVISSDPSAGTSNPPASDDLLGKLFHGHCPTVDNLSLASDNTLYRADRPIEGGVTGQGSALVQHTQKVEMDIGTVDRAIGVVDRMAAASKMMAAQAMDQAAQELGLKVPSSLFGSASAPESGLGFVGAAKLDSLAGQGSFAGPAAALASLWNDLESKGLSAEDKKALIDTALSIAQRASSPEQQVDSGSRPIQPIQGVLGFADRAMSPVGPDFNQFTPADFEALVSTPVLPEQQNLYDLKLGLENQKARNLGVAAHYGHTNVHDKAWEQVPYNGEVAKVVFQPKQEPLSVVDDGSLNADVVTLTGQGVQDMTKFRLDSSDATALLAVATLGVSNVLIGAQKPEFKPSLQQQRVLSAAISPVMAA